MSENGHWAQLWLGASPARPETVQVLVRRGTRQIQQAYTFQAPRAAGDGMAGFSGHDVMYMVMTDRFADGNASNDGPLGHSEENSPEARAERAKPRGWHGGDLRGIADHLDYLQQLGVTTLWPTPVYQNHGPDAYHGYHCTDYYSVDEHYGSVTELQELVAKLHARGMKLVLDTVPNHVGPFHPWVTDEPAPDWFHGTAAHHPAAEYNFKALVDPHSTDQARHGTLTGWFADILPDMNTDSPAVSTYLRQNAVWWIEQTGADGLRIDTFPYVDRQFWQDYDSELKTLFPHLTEVGEIEDADPAITAFFSGGRVHTAGDGSFDTGLYTPFDYPSFFADRAALTGTKPMSAMADVLRSDMLYPHPERLVTIVGNHDQARFLSVPGANAARLRMAFGLAATLRGMPQIYYGDELAMTGGEDPDNRKDMPGGFIGNGADGFTRKGRTSDQEAMHAWVTSVFALRHNSRALETGYQQELFSDASTFAFLRGTEETGDCTLSPSADRYLVVLNVSLQAKTLTLPAQGTKLSGCHHFDPVLGSGISSSANDLGAHVTVPGETIGIFRVHP